MCLALPGKVVRIEGSTCTIDYDGVQRDADVSLLDESVNIGDWLLVHAGFAIQVIDEKVARQAYGLMDEVDARGLR